ncbi:hypothetical protein M404DRAFT_1004866 [Pisolithus tinctorius Marx 270]|uniref:Uncharacterized protein n=1 Tax=Pisolithus tinctorius Marx 270 TaxID=870435 RepID=A0A0C3NUT7_PISTI|nr:hypothetical protein M404DRAFT_1004866 [Pisolithus tinctorius Marx 270]
MAAVSAGYGQYMPSADWTSWASALLMSLAPAKLSTRVYNQKRHPFPTGAKM